MTTRVEEAASMLLGAARHRRTCDPVRALIGSGDIESAYAVQELVTANRRDAGARTVGCKVGLTSRSVQEQFGVFEPDFGRIFDDTVHAHGDELDLSDFLQPRVEAEVAFVLNRPLAQPNPSVADLIRATEFVLPALEIVDSRITGWDLTIADTIADNASSGGVVLGAVPRLLAGLDLSQVGMVLEVDGEDTSFGSGAACMGSPVAAATWVAREMVRRGEPLTEGDIIMSGALGPMVTVTGAGCFAARISGLGAVEAAITQEGKRA